VTTMYGRYAAHGLDTPTGDNWRKQSLCRNFDAELFFPLGGPIQSRTGANLMQERAAKAICNQCPVRERCLQDALDAGDEWGIWGGLNEGERRALRPKKELAPALVAAGVKSAQVRAERAAARDKCDEGHPLTDDNVYVDRTTRLCRTCRVTKQRAYREARKAGAQ
jgi:WhiB family redox-sensing transcriptional regulator